ncbi:hypothetical protein IC235_07905 [Hymenobacter sp. BT664]|uniref:Uncharacterized protein n=1 Tax=Hymenobacter montanus TaxID=2771359 RepID=A0A927GIX4_9BACT|nr:hypothetical protein [Hymenobacter montanus]MBD2767815.1 hypothetical protein [Hymenobacter montanus]
MDKAQIISFAKKISERLESDSRSISTKLIKEVQQNTFKCKIRDNKDITFDLKFFDASGTIESLVLKKSDSTHISQRYIIILRSSGTESSFSATDQDQIKGTENADLYEALKTLYNSIQQASKKNLSSDLDKFIAD